MRMEGRTSSRDMLTIGAGLAGCNRTEVFYGVSFNLRHRRSGTGGGNHSHPRPPSAHHSPTGSHIPNSQAPIVQAIGTTRRNASKTQHSQSIRKPALPSRCDRGVSHEGSSLLKMSDDEFMMEASSPKRYLNYAR